MAPFGTTGMVVEHSTRAERWTGGYCAEMTVVQVPPPSRVMMTLLLPATTIAPSSLIAIAAPPPSMMPADHESL